MMKSIVVTGATSFIGHALVKKLLNNKCAVHAIVRPNSQNISVLDACPDVHIIFLDINNVDKISECGIDSDYFYHLSWKGIGQRGRSDFNLQQENIKDALKCIEAASTIGCKTFIFAGSQAEYGPYNGIYYEHIPCNPVIEYGKAKLKVLECGQQLASNLGMTYIHARIFSVYGAEDHPWTLVSYCIDRLTRGLDLELSECTQLWNYLYIDDAAEAIVALSDMRHRDDPVFNIASKDTRPLKEFVQIIYEMTGCAGKLLFGKHTGSIEKPMDLVPCIDKIVCSTGWLPKTTFENGIYSILNLRKY